MKKTNLDVTENNKKESATSCASSSKTDANNLPFVNIEDETTTKGCRTRTKEDANSLEKDGKEKRYSIVTAEKDFLNYLADCSVPFLFRILRGESVEFFRKSILCTFLDIRKDLKKSGAKDSANVFGQLLSWFLDVQDETGNYDLPSLKDVQAARTTIFGYIKADRLAAEAKAKETEIKKVAETYGIPFEAAKSMYEAGKLKL